MAKNTQQHCKQLVYIYRDVAKVETFSRSRRDLVGSVLAY